MSPGLPKLVFLRRKLLPLIVSGWWWPASSQVGNMPPQLLRSILPPGASFELPFEIRAEGEERLENRIVFGALRSTGRLDAITLLDPSRRVVWRRTPVELGLTPRDQTSQPELGDVIVLPEIRNAINGRWALLLERAKPHSDAGRLLFAWRLLPRFDLLLSTNTPQVAAGQTLLVEVRAMDYGVPIKEIAKIDVALLGDGEQQLSVVHAREHARTRDGIALSNEPGTYIASIVLPQPGLYRLQASHVFGSAPRPTIRRAVLSVTAGASIGALRLLSVRLYGTPGQCARGLTFRFQVELAEPGAYTCTLSLQPGVLSTPRASASAELVAGTSVIDVMVSAAKWFAAGEPSNLARVTLLRIDALGFGVLADINDVSLVGHKIDTSALCR